MKTKSEKMNETMEREGDPNDDYMNEVEEYLIIPRIVENKIKSIHCKSEKDELEACRKKFGIMFSAICLFDTFTYGFCISSMRDSEDLKDDCLEEYLAVRSKYRLTKDPKMLYRLKAMVFPHRYEYSEP